MLQIAAREFVFHFRTLFFFFNDTATTEIYTLSLHDALPILRLEYAPRGRQAHPDVSQCAQRRDRKSTRLNSSHLVISYAVFCLKKKNFVSQPLDLGGCAAVSLDAFRLDERVAHCRRLSPERS